MTADGLAQQREAFDVPADVAYFNTAYMSPLLHGVRAAGEGALARRSRPWTMGPADWFDDVEHLRTAFGQIVGTDAEGIALVPATSYGFAVAARNLPLGAGDRVLVLAEEYPSGIYTWQRATAAAGAEILTVHRSGGQSWTEAVLEVLDERVRIVSVPNVHWTDGALVDLDAVAARTREVGARLVIDGSQSIGALPFDVAAVRPDVVVTVGYKWLLGPYGVGYLYLAPDLRDGVPLEENWIGREGSQDFARLVEYRGEYQPGARRFDVGQRSKFELVPMAAAALAQLLEWEVPRVAATLADTTARLAARLAGLGLEPAPPEARGPHLLGVRLPEGQLDGIVPRLAAAGCHASVRGASLRLAPHLHVNDADIDRLVDALGSW